LDKLTATQIKAELIKLNNWNLKDNLLSRVYKLNSFMDVMSFSNLVSDKSEQIDHHPKMIIDYDTIEFKLSTHSVGGITVLDFELANFIEDTYDELFQPN
jgi:4a-hydroxytetrahydrobiopterin dehydratase